MKKFFVLSILCLMALVSCNKPADALKYNRRYIGTRWYQPVTNSIDKHIIIESEESFALFYTDTNGEPITSAYHGILNMNGMLPASFPAFDFTYVPYYAEDIGEYVAICYTNARIVSEQLLVETCFVGADGRLYHKHYEIFDRVDEHYYNTATGQE